MALKCNWNDINLLINGANRIKQEEEIKRRRIRKENLEKIKNQLEIKLTTIINKRKQNNAKEEEFWKSFKIFTNPKTFKWIVMKMDTIKIYTDDNSILVNDYNTSNIWKEKELKTKEFGLDKETIKFIYNQEQCITLKHLRSQLKFRILEQKLKR
jgi:hypothetical protein